MTTRALLESIVGQIHVGVVVLDPDARVRLWNRFMAFHSGRELADVEGRTLFECFPELPRRWMEAKLRNVILMRQAAFSSWKQRPWLFCFPDRRPLTGGAQWMYQDCTFLPVLNDDSGEVAAVCLTVQDVTDTALYQIELKRTQAHLARLSVSDSLTGIANRRHLEDSLASELKRARRHALELSVIMLDIDHFKCVNDNYGHQAGDEVIRSVARLAADGLRETDILGRYGGEEFTLVLPETGAPGARIVAERLSQKICGMPVEVGSARIPISVSIGVASLLPSDRNHEMLLDRADTALYQAKQEGRNRVSVAPA